MGSFSGLGVGLSILFGCILMGFVAELWYLLCWKKKRPVETATFISCWKRHRFFNRVGRDQELENTSRNLSEHEDLETGSKNPGPKGEEGPDLELMRMHNLCGPPRFLFTIKEESKEDMESEDGRSRKGSRSNKSFGDLVFLTPLSSPTVRGSMLSDSYNSHGFNPLFEALTETDVDRLRSSPPPKFKFLKDAEDKLIRRLFVEEAERKRGLKNQGVVEESVTKDASFVKFSSQAAQVLPLASSPASSPVLDKI